jgi:hypothetical protein
MRIWNLPVEDLDDQHLLGEHLELHIIWNALLGRTSGWRNHPETRRFEGRLGALHRRHEAQVAEMVRRGWRGHKTPLPEVDLSGQSEEWPPLTEDRIAKDRADLIAHFPGWRKARRAGDDVGLGPKGSG